MTLVPCPGLGRFRYTAPWMSLDVTPVVGCGVGIRQKQQHM
jgi:hypothetical protein